MRRLHACGIALFLAAAPVFAGAVYVPIATDVTIGGHRFKTEVWISNLDLGAAKTYSVLFIPAVSDGAAPERPAGRTAIPPSGTFFIANVAAPGSSGLLEIDADSGLVINARLISTSFAGAKLGANLPVISSENVIPAGQSASLQGWGRILGQIVSNLGVVNLGHSDTTCTVQVFRANGSQIATTAQFALPPLSQVQFDEALALLGESNITDVRGWVSCDQPFYAYVSVYNLTTGEVLVISPSAEGALGLAPPGQGGPGPGPVPGGSRVLQVNGMFHRPSPGNESKRFDLRLPDGTYSEMRAEFDLTVGNYHHNNGGKAHQIIGMIRHDRWRGNVMFWNNAFDRGTIRSMTNMDLGPGDVRRSDINFMLQPGETYHVTLTWNHGQRRRTTTFSQNGNVVAALVDQFTRPLSFGTSDPGVALGFGHEGHERGGEEATYGWEYANLLVVFTP